MGRLNGRGCLVWSIANTTACTIEPRTRTNPHACERSKCGNSQRQVKYSAFILLIAPLSGQFQPRGHRVRAQEDRATLQSRFQVCNELTGVKLVGYQLSIPGLSVLSPLFPLFNSSIIFFSTSKLTVPSALLHGLGSGLLLIPRPRT
jgi:hypothetical protein